jgi:hypothetical protein
MSSPPRNVQPLINLVVLLVMVGGCGPGRMFDDDGPFQEKTYLPPLVSFQESEGHWPATKDELRSFCDRQGIEMNPGFWDHVRMAPADDALVVLWHNGDDYVSQRWRLVDGQPKSEAIAFEAARRVLRRAGRTDEPTPASNTPL